MDDDALDLMTVRSELRDLHNALGELARWGDQHLDTDADRQYIAEHLTGSLAALLDGGPLPHAPF
ncbi:hypothetical protein GCM10010399_32210 [Dactylosporangium fulvum]|uniref:Uncharacterized protein n=1 Tax=Dactylosporangium fulvum TaxID=53359 RepID=A0ABY5W1L2_9ACTN|nr:hypothetical protein [Dactylosporangium fulvum]UWP83917.1 hypothetical protein Dfulv_06590 [Dactylosporangium fulvum]